MTFLLLTGLEAKPATAELDSRAVQQNINNLIKPSPLPDSMAQKAQAFDAQVAQANKAVEIERQQEAQKAAEAAVVAQPVQQSYTGDVPSIIVYWANYYGVSSDWLLRVAHCESGFNPNAVNYGYYAGGGHPSGVFQFLPETFARYSSRAGFSGYIFNASDNARAAAYAFSVGGSGEWECK